MAIQISISNAIGSRYRGSVVPPIDPDAQAFITAASITDPTQQSAINQLVVDLKGYNIWTKFKAIYPIVGGVSSSHAVNLKTPGTYNMSFATGWMHSSTGMTPNGATYANTGININSVMSLNSMAFGVYSRTNSSGSATAGAGAGAANQDSCFIVERWTDNVFYGQVNTTANTSIAVTNSSGFYQASRTASNAVRLVRNTTHATSSVASTAKPNLFFLFGARSVDLNNATIQDSSREIAFGYLSDGFTQTECDNLYTAVQAFQTTLGRSIGTQTVSDADAQAFVNAANITDQVEANAVNNLVIGMKADGLWTKMKAIYPVVGGVASSHAVNLKTPGTYNLTFSTGWTHSSTGMTPNGTSAYANTNLTPSTAMPSGGDSLHYYSRTNSNITGDNLIAGELSAPFRALILRGKDSSGTGSYLTTNPSSAYQSASQTDVSRDARGLFSGSSDSSNTYFYLKGIQLANNTSAQTYTARYSNVLFIGARRGNNGVALNFTDKECAYASIGEGLTTTDMLNYNTRVQTFQTALNRQV